MSRLIDAERFEVITLQGKSDDFIDGVTWLAERIDEAETIMSISEDVTNKEVFKDVFGFEPNTNTCVMSKDCCNGNPAECDDCRFNDWWNVPYKRKRKE